MATSRTVEQFQDDLRLKSLDFPGRTWLTVPEVAEKLGVTPEHIVNLINAGELAASNISLGKKRDHWRIHITHYWAFIIARFTGPTCRETLKDMSVDQLKSVRRDINEILTIRTNTLWE